MPDVHKTWRFYVKYSDGLICWKIIRLCLIGMLRHMPYNKLRRRFYGSVIRVLPKWINMLKWIHNCSCVSYISLQYQCHGCILNIISKKRYILNVDVSVFRVRNKYGTLRTSEWLFELHHWGRRCSLYDTGNANLNRATFQYLSWLLLRNRKM